MRNSLEIAQSWVEAANSQNADRLLKLSDSNIEIVGPRGSAFGHHILREWLERAGLNLTTLRTFTRADAVVLAQHGIWRSPENEEIIGEADVASEFIVKDQKVFKYARFETLDEALKSAQLDFSDEQR